VESSPSIKTMNILLVSKEAMILIRLNKKAHSDNLWSRLQFHVGFLDIQEYSCFQYTTAEIVVL
jgi:hypothetical protein